MKLEYGTILVDKKTGDYVMYLCPANTKGYSSILFLNNGPTLWIGVMSREWMMKDWVVVDG